MIGIEGYGGKFLRRLLTMKGKIYDYIKGLE